MINFTRVSLLKLLLIEQRSSKSLQWSGIVIFWWPPFFSNPEFTGLALLHLHTPQPRTAEATRALLSSTAHALPYAEFLCAHRPVGINHRHPYGPVATFPILSDRWFRCQKICSSLPDSTIFLTFSTWRAGPAKILLNLVELFGYFRRYEQLTSMPRPTDNMLPPQSKGGMSSAIASRCSASETLRCSVQEPLVLCKTAAFSSVDLLPREQPE